MARKLHLIIALIAGVFILLGALTGAILAVESVYNQTLPYKSAEFEKATLAQTIAALKEKKIDALKLTIDRNHFVQVETAEGKKLFIHPQSGAVMDGNYKPSKFIQFVKTLHRSLYMGKTGRVIMGITALCFAIIALSGIWLIVRKQQRWRHFFRKLPEGEGFYPHYHSAIGRWMLVFIFIICLTGVYMTLETIGILPKFKAQHEYDASTLSEEPVKDYASFEVFNAPLSEVRSVEFPAFEDVEEVYKIDFINKNVIVNQFTGEIISTSTSPFKGLAYLVRTLHIGKGHYIWATLLFISCLAILFFIYSGFAITLKRRKKSVNPFAKEVCEYIVLVGTEGGSTREFARAVHDDLLRQGKRSYIADMNDFGKYPQLEQLLIFTSTYGDGDAPMTGTRFAELWKKHPIVQSFGYTVVGFGSLSYPEFCRFAKEVDVLLAKEPQAKAMTPLHTINDQSVDAFRQWAEKWSATQDLNLRLPSDFLTRKKRKRAEFAVVERTPVMDDDIFLVRLKPLKNVAFESGDLLGITPADGRERLYSIAKYREEIWLSVKLVAQGVVSNLLNDLPIGETLRAVIEPNPNFHFPKKAPQVVCIANGAGMAPFLGMIEENTDKKPLTLVWGCRREASLELYRPYIDPYIEEGKISTYWQAVSREGDKFYVQDIIHREGSFFANLLAEGGVVMICGSMAMLKAVKETLEEVCHFHLRKPLSYFENNGQIKTDCY